MWLSLCQEGERGLGGTGPVSSSPRDSCEGRCWPQGRKEGPGRSGRLRLPSGEVQSHALTYWHVCDLKSQLFPRISVREGSLAEARCPGSVPVCPTLTAGSMTSG